MSQTKYGIYSSFFKRREVNKSRKQTQQELNNRHHEQLSRLVRNIFYLYIFLNLFCLITLYTTSIEYLIKTSSVITIPILNSAVSYKFFVAAGAIVISSIFVYLSIRLEELDGIVVTRKIPYVFNSPLKPVRQLSNVVVYFLGPLTILMFANKAYLFSDLDNLLSLVFFLCFFSLRLYNKRELSHWIVKLGIVIFFVLFIYTFVYPMPVRFIKEKVDVVGENLKGVRLEGYRLDNALMNHTRFQEANISDSNIEHSEMWGAIFDSALIYNSKISYTIADHADFSRAIVRDVEFKTVTLTYTNFSEAILVNVTFSGSDVRFSKPAYNIVDDKVTLHSADFNGATFVDIDFRDVDLTSANFSNTDLESVEFTNAILNKTDFTATLHLTCEKIRKAKEASNVILPRYLNGCKKDEEVSKSDEISPENNQRKTKKKKK